MYKKKHIEMKKLVQRGAKLPVRTNSPLEPETIMSAEPVPRVQQRELDSSAGK